MARSTSGRLAPEPTSLHDSVEYDSVRSFVGRAQESPPSATQVPATPLLDTATLTRMRQLQASAPLIYPEASPVPPAPRPESIASSDLQAEVRKQLMELMASRDEESRRLRAQVEALSLENQSLRLRIEADVQPGMQSSKPGVSNPTGFGGLSWLGRGLGTLMGQQRAGRVMEPSSSQSPPPPPPAPPIMPQGKDPATGEHPGYTRQPLDFGVRPPGLVAMQPSAFNLVPKVGSTLGYQELVPSSGGPNYEVGPQPVFSPVCDVVSAAEPTPSRTLMVVPSSSNDPAAQSRGQTHAMPMATGHFRASGLGGAGTSEVGPLEQRHAATSGLGRAGTSEVGPLGPGHAATSGLEYAGTSGVGPTGPGRVEAPSAGHAVTPDPMSVVLTGMAQLQSVVSELTSPKSSSKPETIKPGVGSLPALPSHGPESCLYFADWLHETKPALADISDSSEDLWALTVAEATAWYGAYLKLDPLSRLTSKPVPSPELSQPKWTRVSRRIENMILMAAPLSVKEEVSASRTSGLLAVVCKLFVVYGPGSLTEKEIGLRHIQDPPAGTTIQDTIEGLRRWQRWCSRMTELGGVLPDPALQVKALTRIMRSVLSQHSELAFRVNLTRASLQLDLTPDNDKVSRFHAQVLSELESIAHRVDKDKDKDKGN